MKDYSPRPFELSSDMVAYLEEATKEYSLTDMHKALRCLINYARDNPERRDEIFNEIRCLGC